MRRFLPFHDWDGACNNPKIVPLDKNSVLFFYSDFYYLDETGVKRKTILCRKISVEKQQRYGKGTSLKIDQ